MYNIKWVKGRNLWGLQEELLAEAERQEPVREAEGEKPTWEHKETTIVKPHQAAGPEVQDRAPGW